MTERQIVWNCSLTILYFVFQYNQKLLTHPLGVSESHAGEFGRAAQFLLDAQELVVLGGALATTRRARLDLTRAQTDGEIGNVVVLGFSRTVRGHDAPSILFGQLDGVDGFGDGTDLVDFEQEAVGRLGLDGLLDLGRVGDGQVVTDNLDLFANFRRDGTPIGPVVLVKRIQSGLLVAMVHRDHGPGALRALLEGFGRGERSAEIVEKVLGVGGTMGTATSEGSRKKQSKKQRKSKSCHSPGTNSKAFVAVRQCSQAVLSRRGYYVRCTCPSQKQIHFRA